MEPLKRGLQSLLPGIFLVAVNVSGALAAGPIVLDMVYNNLGEVPRVSAFNDPKTLAVWGYSGQVPHLYVQCAVTFDSLEPGIVPQGSETRQWITRQAAKVDQRLAEAEAAGIKLTAT